MNDSALIRVQLAPNRLLAIDVVAQPADVLAFVEGDDDVEAEFRLDARVYAIDGHEVTRKRLDSPQAFETIDEAMSAARACAAEWMCLPRETPGGVEGAE